MKEEESQSVWLAPHEHRAFLEKKLARMRELGDEIGIKACEALLAMSDDEIAGCAVMSPEANESDEEFIDVGEWTIPCLESDCEITLRIDQESFVIILCVQTPHATSCVTLGDKGSLELLEDLKDVIARREKVSPPTP